jgi:lipopolysaccharide/colanic/teichoic acid biosynthesis glycosyltransferase
MPVPYAHRLARLALDPRGDTTRREKMSGGWQLQVKRGLDIAVAGRPAVPVPVVGDAAFIRESGAVFYARQARGCGGRMFGCWKFRTMPFRAHLATQLKALIKPTVRTSVDFDPRVTSGPMLRNGISTIPQLFNAGQRNEPR